MLKEVEEEQEEQVVREVKREEFLGVLVGRE